MHIIGHRKPSAPLPAPPIRQKQAARADRFPPYMTARMGKAVERKRVAQASWGWGSPCSELALGLRTVRWDFHDSSTPRLSTLPGVFFKLDLRRLFQLILNVSCLFRRAEFSLFRTY